MWSQRLQLRIPGLFITATDTGVGKTTVACAIAWNLHRQLANRAAGKEGSRVRVGVCKPLATGCRKEREGLVSPDAEALAHFADCRLPLDVINPVRYAPPLAPAPASEAEGKPVDWDMVAGSLQRLHDESDCLIIEGIGGLLVPLSPRPRNLVPRVEDALRFRGRDYLTVLDLIAAIGYSTVIVARAGLGTLNHTAMTAELLRQSRCAIAGIVINGYVAEPAAQIGDAEADVEDPSIASNRLWLEKATGLPILAIVPRCNPADVKPDKGRISAAVLEAVGQTFWPDVLALPGASSK